MGFRNKYIFFNDFVHHVSCCLAVLSLIYRYLSDYIHGREFLSVLFQMWSPAPQGAVGTSGFLHASRFFKSNENLCFRIGPVPSASFSRWLPPVANIFWVIAKASDCRFHSRGGRRMDCRFRAVVGVQWIAD